MFVFRMAIEYFQRMKNRMHKHIKLQSIDYMNKHKQFMYVTLISDHNIQFYHVWVFLDNQERIYQSFIIKKSSDIDVLW